MRRFAPPSAALLLAAAALTAGPAGAGPEATPEVPPGELPAWTPGTLDVHQISTGRGNAALIVFPDGTTLLVRYGRFDLYTGGDLAGVPDDGTPAWFDVETPIARALGPTDVVVVDHHGSIDPANPFFLATLHPRVLRIPAWSPTHPAPVVLKRLLNERIYPGPRDVFATFLREATRLTIGPRADRLAADHGHLVVRVEPGGDRYRVWVLDDRGEDFRVL